MAFSLYPDVLTNIIAGILIIGFGILVGNILSLVGKKVLIIGKGSIGSGIEDKIPSVIPIALMRQIGVEVRKSSALGFPAALIQGIRMNMERFDQIA